MFKKPTRKQFIIRRILLSAVATLSVIIIVTATILFMLGYRLDGGNGRLEQGALLQFDSNPNGASVSIDGVDIGVRTAGKQTVVAGTHTIMMKRSGYEDWSRTIGLTAGTLTWLDYIRLVPKERTPETIASYATMSGALFSPDLKWGVLQTKANSPTFRVLDLRSQDVKANDIIVAPDLYSDATTEGVTHTFSMVRWNVDSRYVLVKHSFKETHEWLLLDTQDVTKTVNITRLLSVDFSDLQFASKNGTTLYGLSADGIVRKIDLPAATISRALLNKVKSFSVYDSSIISYIGFSNTEPAVQVAGIYRDGDDAGRVLKNAPDATTPLFIASTRYFGDDYVAIGFDKNVTIFKGSIPSANAQDASSLKQFAAFSTQNVLTALSFSPKGDYALAQAGSLYSSYELEHKRITSGALATSSPTAPTLEWLDGAHLVTRDAGSLAMRDFDGTNTHTIMPIDTTFNVTLSQNGKYFYGINKKADGTFVLQRVKMILD